jgi:hypothetical protein
MENDERVMLQHKETKGFFNCPKLAVEAMKELGWEETDNEPVEVNPTLAERPKEWFEPIPGPAPTKSVKPSKRASATTEGSDTVG